MLWVWKSAARAAALGVIWTFTSGASSCSVNDTDPRFVADLVLRDAVGAVRDEFANGEPVTLELTVRNRSDAEAVLQFASGHQFEFIVIDAGTSRVRWKWSSDKAFIQATTELIFAPGEIHTFTAAWDQVGDDGQPVGPGNYEARGALLFAELETNPLTSHQLGSPLEAFRIH